MTTVNIYWEDNLSWMHSRPTESYDLVYVDPPFNTGKTQKLGSKSYADCLGDEYFPYMIRRVDEIYRLLKPTGSLFMHLDWRTVHAMKANVLDDVFGKASFMNEIIWAYDYGGRSKRKWSTKHDTILWYAKDPKNYTFNYEAMERIPYMAPGLVGPEKAAKGKTPTDVWWHTIVPTNGKERVGYPTQKPIGILKRIVEVHSNPGDRLLDCFAGSGSFGATARLLGRSVDLVDNNEEACYIMGQRLGIEGKWKA